MRIRNLAIASFAAIALCACSQPKGESTAAGGSLTASSDTTVIDNVVIETIMSRRSVRDYLPQPVGRDTMEVITKCGINAPNGMNRQPWEIRVVDNQELLSAMTQAFVNGDPKRAADSKMTRNMFRNAPTVVFIAAENNSQLDCGLLGENMILAAWSMGIGSCCLGGPVAFLKSDAASGFLKQLDFPEGYELVYAIGFGYPAESPEAKPRDEGKVRFL
ncbi:MAG: nitroreductase family protein [Muribaculaceae bacterium]|nr:nitroreductase family protein [Muribaculaceae bacterium]MDE6532597.1 nitroreductase family protein [Muribaculaceae bacterium]